MTKKKSFFETELKEIFYHAVNSLLAGGLVFAGAFTTGNVTSESIYIALSASGIVAISKFYDYWKSQEKEYKNKKGSLFNFV